MGARPRLLLLVLVLAAFALSAVDGGEGSPFDPLRSAAEAVVGPAERAAGSVGGALSSLGDLADRDELADLREENDRLRRELAAGEADARVSREWRALLEVSRDLTVVPARVVAAGGALGFERTVSVDVGEADGVAVGQTVLAGPGLVGRTVRVGRWTSEVLLADDPSFGVGTRLSATGALGLASGDGPGRLRWVQVDQGPVEPGQTLVTTGSDTFVPDLPVGRVVEVGESPGGLTTTAVVEPLADLSRLDVVGVVVDPARTQPRPTLGPS